jgi:hypothetical protein
LVLNNKSNTIKCTSRDRGDNNCPQKVNSQKNKVKRFGNITPTKRNSHDKAKYKTAAVKHIIHQKKEKLAATTTKQ